MFFLLPCFSFFLPVPFYFTRPIPFYFLSLSPTLFCSSDCILCNFIPLLSILYSVLSRIGVRISAGTRNCFLISIAATPTLGHVHLSIQWYEARATLTSRFPLEERAAAAWGLTFWSTWCWDQECVNPRVFKVWYSKKQRDCYFTFLKERTFTASSKSALCTLGCQYREPFIVLHSVSLVLLYRWPKLLHLLDTLLS